MIKTINGATFRKMIVAGAGLLEQNKKYKVRYGRI